jgi:MoaA/NifB/PqqE/SkfB family radical SAM enzyme
LADVARAFGRHGLRHLAIPTNGLIEDRQHEFIDRVLAENPDLYLSIAVSFDGPPPIHDAIRQIQGGHARSMESVRALKAHAKRVERLGVGILVCVTSENQDVLADHVEELVHDLQPDNVTINLARGTALDPSLLKVDIARYEEVVERKRKLFASGALPYFDFPLAKLAVARDDLMYEHVASVARGGESARHLPCTAGKLSAVIFESGEVHPCEILGRSIGNLNDVDWDLASLWSSAEAERLRAEIKATRCTCTWECAQADNVLFNARNWPRLAAGVLRS